MKKATGIIWMRMGFASGTRGRNLQVGSYEYLLAAWLGHLRVGGIEKDCSGNTVGSPALVWMLGMCPSFRLLPLSNE